MLLKHSKEDNTTTASETSPKYISLNIVEKVMCDCIHDVGSAEVVNNLYACAKNLQLDTGAARNEFTSCMNHHDH